MADELAEGGEDFFQRIDCRFPYNDRAAASALIIEAKSISDNACFAVLEEISRRPRSVKVTRKRQRELCAEWADAFRHPLTETVLPFAMALIDGPQASPEQCSAAMKLIAGYPGQWAALNVVYFAASDEDPDALAAIEEMSATIRASW
jgi:hypothetical protein